MSKTKFFTLFVASLSIVSISSAFAQTVVLTCKSGPLQEYIAKRLSESERQLCSNSLNSHQREYTFDKKSLSDRNESIAEVVNQTCWGVNDFSRVLTNATSSLISFYENKSSEKFNVDRETLNGGWRDLRDWQCEVKEKVLKNKI